jgi:hypothetical protein
MPIDPTGTSPEPVAEAPEEVQTVNLKCKRDGCDSMTAIELKIPGHNAATGRHMYACKKCKLTWSVNIGGTFNF